MQHLLQGAAGLTAVLAAVLLQLLQCRRQFAAGLTAVVAAVLSAVAAVIVRLGALAGGTAFRLGSYDGPSWQCPETAFAFRLTSAKGSDLSCQSIPLAA